MMILTISCVILFVFLFVQTFFLGGSYMLGILGMAAAAAGIVLWILFKIAKKSRIAAITAVAGILVFGVCCACMAFPAKEGTLQEKAKLIQEMVTSKDTETAEERYEECIDYYGEDDDVHLAMAKYYLSVDDTDDCARMLDWVKNQTTIDFYLTKLEMYNRTPQPNSTYITSLLLDAVEDHPTWAKGHLLLGIAYTDNQYDIYKDAAEYYLRKAAALDPKDGYAPCWLEIVAYQRGDYEAAKEHLKDASALKGKDIYLTNLISYYKAAVEEEVQD